MIILAKKGILLNRSFAKAARSITIKNYNRAESITYNNTKVTAFILQNPKSMLLLLI